MKMIGKLIGKIWRYWYYVLAGVFIIILFPFLYLFSLKDSWFRGFSIFGKLWARAIVHGMGFGISITYEEKIPRGQYIVCPNHSSYLDIPLIISILKFPVKFIGKYELGKIPIFGTLYRRTAVLVNRNSVSSRKEALSLASNVVKNGHSMCFFPEGKVPRDKKIVLDTFKNGAFNVAINQQIPIIPVTFVNAKKLYPARSTAGRPGLLKVVVHKPVPTKGMTTDDIPTLKETIYTTIYNTLKSYGSK